MELTAIAFDVELRRRGDGAQLALRGELDVAAVAKLERAIDAALAMDRRSPVIDLCELTFIDAAGLRELLRAHERAIRGDFEVRIINAPPRIRRVRDICGVQRLLPLA